MKAAIENLAKIEGRNKILMLGGMAELGAESLKEHQKILDIIQQYDWKDVVLVGGDFLKLRHPFITFQNASDAGKWLKEQHLQNDYILIKGSRSMQMEKVIE
jgi:UDP-N-acetylmuramoyl-tripeptide--D-alanyl-D-alanine ligase